MNKDTLRKITVTVGLVGLLVSVTVLSYSRSVYDEETKYADAKTVLENLAASLETFVEEMDRAENSKTVARVLDGMAEGMKELLPEINAIREKYPELKSEDTHPEELKPLLQRIDKDFRAMMKSYGKVKEHIDDPAVKAADEKYKEVMSDIN
jgi:hypothetical protein